MTDNYAMSPEGKERLLLEIALATIFFYKTIFWLVVANLSVFIIKSSFKNRYKASGIAALIGVTFYFTAGNIVEKYCALSYYMVFVNQSVAEEYLKAPIKEAGYYIGPILTDKINDKNMELRRYAISGLGDIKYKPATETLRQILLDTSELDYVRADAFVVLTKFNTSTANKVLLDFKLSTTDTIDMKVIELGNYFLHAECERYAANSVFAKLRADGR